MGPNEGVLILKGLQMAIKFKYREKIENQTEIKRPINILRRS